MNRLPKANPDVQQSQATADPAHKAIGEETAQCRVGQKNAVVGPFWPPRNYYKQNPGYSAYKDEQQNCQAMEPSVEPGVAGFRVLRQLWQDCYWRRNRIPRTKPGFKPAWCAILGGLRICHRAPPHDSRRPR